MGDSTKEWEDFGKDPVFDNVSESPPHLAMAIGAHKNYASYMGSGFQLTTADTTAKRYWIFKALGALQGIQEDMVKSEYKEIVFSLPNGKKIRISEVC